jgi:hypothetical protein
MAFQGRCIGRILNFLSEIWLESKAYECTFENGEIFHFQAKKITYSWEENTDIPIFYFKGNLESLNEAQYNKRNDIIKIFGYSELEINDKDEDISDKYTKKIKGYL